MNQALPVVLEASGIRLEPMTDEHHEALAVAAADGRLWETWFIAVPPPEGMRRSEERRVGKEC